MQPFDSAVLDDLIVSTKDLNDRTDEWTATFGFPHLCQCDQDYADGKMVEAPECWATMADDALHTCKRFVLVLRAIHGMTEDDKIKALIEEHLA